MELFTRVTLPKSAFKIDFTKKLAFWGSCLADNISVQFARRKFCTLANPFGTVYNPLSIERMLQNIADGKVFGENDVFQDFRANNGGDGLWHSWDAHSSLSASTRKECIDKLNRASAQAREFLQQADVVFVTLGSAFVYSLKNVGRVVANCHRQDPRMFDRRLVSVEDAAEAIRGIIKCLRSIKSRDWILRRSTPQDDEKGTQSDDFHIVFTVSPIRHPGDGAHGNNLSKATVLLAVNQVVAEMQASAAPIEYFPSYEIVMDELRDYRFYESDMIHLSKTAEQIIFERMVECYCDGTTKDNIAKVEKFLKMANHRIVDADSPAAQEFQKKLAEQSTSLEKQIAGLVLNAEN